MTMYCPPGNWWSVTAQLFNTRWPTKNPYVNVGYALLKTTIILYQHLALGMSMHKYALTTKHGQQQFIMINDGQRCLTVTSSNSYQHIYQQVIFTMQGTGLSLSGSSNAQWSPTTSNSAARHEFKKWHDKEQLRAELQTRKNVPRRDYEWSTVCCMPSEPSLVYSPEKFQGTPEKSLCCIGTREPFKAWTGFMEVHWIRCDEYGSSR